MSKIVKITFTGGSLLGEWHELDVETPVVLGRSREADFYLRESDVSHKHVEFSARGTDVRAKCLSPYGMRLNGREIAIGESDVLHAGDRLEIGGRVKFRVDSVASGDDSMSGAHSPAGRDTVCPASGTLESWNAISSAPTRKAPDDDPETVLTSIPDAWNSSPSVFPRPPVRKSSGLPDDTDISATAMHAPETSGMGTPSGFGMDDSGPVTQEMGTAVLPRDQILRVKRMIEEKKRLKRKIASFAVLLLLAVAGTAAALFVLRKDDSFVKWPLRAGTQKPDNENYLVKANDGKLEMVVDYPRNKAAKIFSSPDGASFSAATWAGRNRDVPFRIDFVRRNDPSELDLSLEQSAARCVASLEAKGYAFLTASDESFGDQMERDGYFFYELKYPTAFSGSVQRGTLVFRREFTREDAGVKWHGMLLYMRRNAFTYTLRKEIPETWWERGKYLMREDSNLCLYPAFVVNRWESPGREGLLDGWERDSLRRSVDSSLGGASTVDWKSLSEKLDTLVAMSMRSSADDRKSAFALLSRFRDEQDRQYNALKIRFAAARRNGDWKGLRDACEACRGVFGADRHDMRSRLVDSEEWSWQQKR